MVRRSIAAGAGVLVLILLVLGMRACLDSRKERAIQDYVRDVGALVGESNQQSKSLFQTLGASEDTEDVDIENQLNGFRNLSAQLVDRARNADAPDEMGRAQRYLVETLEFRRDGLARIADQLPAAIAQQDDRKQGTRQIAQDMQDFLTSDVIYAKRVAPTIADVLKSEELAGEPIPKSQFLPSVDWLEESTVASRIGKLGGGGGGAKDGDAAPGLHGNGVAGATLGGQTLSPGGSASIPSSGDLKFEVQVANQGENTETDVKVTATVGKGGDAIKLDTTLDTIAAGETKTVEIPLEQKPPTGQNVPIVIEVEPVAGEDKTDNNKAEYAAIFTS